MRESTLWYIFDSNLAYLWILSLKKAKSNNEMKLFNEILKLIDKLTPLHKLLLAFCSGVLTHIIYNYIVLRFAIFS